MSIYAIIIHSILHLTYAVLLLYILLGYLYVSLDEVGVVIAGFGFVSVTLITEINIFKFSFLPRLLMFIVLVVAAYFLIGTWMINHARGGTYAPVSGLETRARWINGADTEFGKSSGFSII